MIAIVITIIIKSWDLIVTSVLLSNLLKTLYYGEKYSVNNLTFIQTDLLLNRRLASAHTRGIPGRNEGSHLVIKSHNLKVGQKDIQIVTNNQKEIFFLFQDLGDPEE